MSELASEQATEGGGALRFQMRWAGILAIAGTVLTIVSNLLQQRADIPRGDTLGVLEYIDGKPWLVAAFAGVLGMLCWVMAFTTAGRALREPVSRSIARMAEVTLIVAVALFAVNFAHDGFSSGVLAQEWASGEIEADAAAVDIRVVEGLVGGTSILSQTLLGLALALYALAMTRSGQYSRVLSWMGIVGTLGWFLGGSALFLQLPGASFELLLPFVGLATVWVLGVGITLIRRSSQGSRA
ncbi:DUF4386 family protein [Actinobacteria bacterium YIM 96077]|uniref:DUF4386 domain-containing protein n=1 Tax=Phytoactinopolyspora halophila TaxID=1981511 RepID=A0A329QHJ4_9ACTN|nr:DUF4386 family protein [Phytoactinopolyspora halophila]AYY11807.1 DUF4386 family protein [Actinobacteria bacterium YIM 96077]RAW09828.1 DUF4386 domain-containing protein [Phytoactinopolyspora halophila]